MGDIDKRAVSINSHTSNDIPIHMSMTSKFQTNVMTNIFHTISPNDDQHYCQYVVTNVTTNVNSS